MTRMNSRCLIENEIRRLSMLVTGGKFRSKQHGAVGHDFFTGLYAAILRFEPDRFGILESDTDLSLDELTRSRFNENLIAGRKAMERVEHAKQHQANLTQATSGERRILELQRLLTDIEGGIGGKTTVHKLNDVLREAAESRDDFSVDEYGKLIQLIARIQLLDNKKIQKACKKFAATEQS